MQVSNCNLFDSVLLQTIFTSKFRMNIIIMEMEINSPWQIAQVRTKRSKQQ
jgi:hypothetical protein